jgi:ribose transport system ATP-binding protein
MTTALLEARGISKSFGGVQALSGVTIHLGRGETLALVGENGAGKSTLMKILSGVHSPDAGELLVDGVPVPLKGVGDALQRGIVLIHQELNLAENLSIAANLFLGLERNLLGIGWLDRAAEHRQTEHWLQRIGLAESPDRIVGTLAPGQRQLVEIARALVRSARVIIMDEPTSSLTQKETDRLYEVIDDLKRQKVSVVYISHRLAEVKRVADRVTVLRDGKNAGELAKAEIEHEAMIRLMVGRELKQIYPRATAAAKPAAPAGDDHIQPAPQERSALSPTRPSAGQVRLCVDNVTYAKGPKTSVSFSLHAGEIVGMAGLVGAGRTELAEALYGLRTINGGSVTLDGQSVKISHPSEAVERGLLLIPEDRRKHGLVLEFSIRENLALPNYDELSLLGWVLASKVSTLANSMMQRLRVRASGPNQRAGSLSGGNQQKIVLGKWLARDAKVIILDEPTRGVDVGARSEIYAIMDQLAKDGMAVLMISSDMEEVLGMSDRVLVLHEGRLAGELSKSQLSEEAIMRLATGG